MYHYDYQDIENDEIQEKELGASLSQLFYESGSRSSPSNSEK